MKGTKVGSAISLQPSRRTVGQLPGKPAALKETLGLGIEIRRSKLLHRVIGLAVGSIIIGRPAGVVSEAGKPKGLCCTTRLQVFDKGNGSNPFHLHPIQSDAQREDRLTGLG